MDPTLRPKWEQFRPSSQSGWCPPCGQTRVPGRLFCGICAYHIDNSVLSVCRSLLLESSEIADKEQKKAPEEKKDPEEKPPHQDREVAVASIAKRFPRRFARLIGRRSDLLRKAGAWFAHVIAFRYVIAEEFQDESVSPNKVYEHPIFLNIRDITYQAIHEVAALEKINDEEDPPPSLETLNSLFNGTEGTQGTARRSLYDMIADLERRKKIRVSRGGAKCAQCGVSIPVGATLCQACSESEQAIERLSISRSLGIQKPKPEAPPPQVSSEGMHIKRD